MSNAPSDADITETIKQTGLVITGTDKNAKVILQQQNASKMHLKLGFYTNCMA